LRRYSRPALGWAASLLSLALLIGAISDPSDAARTPSLGPAPGPLTGKLLVASTSMGDPRFKRTVIYIVRHDTKGAMGLVINRLIGKLPLAKLLAGFGRETDGIDGEIDIHYGGPVEKRVGFVLHSPEFVQKGTTVVNGEVALTRDIGILAAISAGKGPKQSLFAFGYAGWAPRQLEGEIARKDWVTVPGDAKFVFDGKLETKWRRAMDRLGVDL
jgi:putative transcriptional regulator